MTSKRTVAVLGAIPRDHIATHRGETFDKYGCVVYTVAATSALLGPDDCGCPVVDVRREDEEPIKDLLAVYQRRPDRHPLRGSPQDDRDRPLVSRTR